MPQRPKLTHVLLAAVLMAVLITPFAVAQSGNTGARIERSDARYAFLARNTLQGDGGAAALACRSDINPAGQTNREPCLNMVNTGTGFAAAFRTRGLTGFRLQTSGAGTATPFLLDSNATGKVQFLNADQLDGLSVEQIRPRFARINVTAGAASLAEGANGVTAVNRLAAGRYRVTFDSTAANCAYQVTSTQSGQARTTAAVPVTGEAQNVDVTIRRAADGAGNADEGQLVDGGFSITASC